MTDPSRAGHNLEILHAAIDILAITPEELWLAFYSLGGNASMSTVAGWAAGAGEPGEPDYAVLSVVANEALTDRGLDPIVPAALDSPRLR